MAGGGGSSLRPLVSLPSFEVMWDGSKSFLFRFLVELGTAGPLALESLGSQGGHLTCRESFLLAPQATCCLKVRVSASYLVTQFNRFAPDPCQAH